MIVAATTTTPVDSIIAIVTAIVNAAGTWLTSIVSTVMQSGNELLLFWLLVGFLGTAIGLLMRFVRR